MSFPEHNDKISLEPTFSLENTELHDWETKLAFDSLSFTNVSLNSENLEIAKQTWLSRIPLLDELRGKFHNGSVGRITLTPIPDAYDQLVDAKLKRFRVRKDHELAVASTLGYIVSTTVGSVLAHDMGTVSRSVWVVRNKPRQLSITGIGWQRWLGPETGENNILAIHNGSVTRSGNRETSGYTFRKLRGR